MAENIELGEIGERENDFEEETNQDEETNLDEDTNLDNEDLLLGDNELNKIIPVPSGFNPDVVNRETFRNARRNDGVLRRVFIQDKRNFLRDALDINLKKGDGHNSSILLDNLSLTNDQRTGKNNGAKYKGVKILVLKNGEYDYSTNTNKKTTDTIKEFKQTLEKAKAEHAKTLDGQTEQSLKDEGVTSPTSEHSESIRANTTERVEEQIEDNMDKIISSEKLYLTEAELREFRGILDIDKQQGQTVEEQLDLLENVEKPHWLNKAQEAENEGKTERAKLLKSAADTAQLKADYIRLKNNIPVESEEVQSILDEETETNPLTRFEKFKKFAKENLLGLSAVSVSVAGIITTIVIAGKSAVKAGANATKKFAKGLSKIAEKVAPVIGGVLNIVAKMLTLGAKGLNWISRNLWSLALLIVLVVYNEISKRRRK